MADNVTVDELSFRIAANAADAAKNIDTLTASLQNLSGVLAPVLTQLRAVAPAVAQMAGATKGISKVVPAATAVAPTTAAVAMAPAIPVIGNAAPKNLSLLGRVTQAVTTKVGALTSALGRMGTGGTKAVNALGGSFIQLRSTIFYAFFIIGALVKLFEWTIGRASSAVETLNLFNVAFGDMAGTAAKWVALTSGKLGLDPNQFAKTAATFMEMNRAMGLNDEMALKMSQNLTQLSYDYSSLFDIPFEKSAEKFRSAMAGQTRAVRTFGLDVTQTALQDEIYAEGLKYKIRELNRASKAVLIHNALLRNSTRAQGDLARTLASPANLMRVFADQARVAAISIGYVFLPMVQAILPWLIFFAQAVNNAARSFAGLFGIKVPSWDDFSQQVTGVGGGVEDIYGDMSGVAGATDKAAKAAKELRDYTLGIDELNILSPDKSAGGAGGGGVGGLGGVAAGIKPFDVYDMIGGVDALKKLLDPIKEMFGRVKETLAPFVKAIGEVWDALKPFAANVWQGFTSFWKDVLVPLGVWTMNTVGVGALNMLRDVLNWFNEHPNAAKLVGAAIAAFTALKGLDTVMGIMSKFGKLFFGLFSLPNLAGIGAGLGTLGGWLLGTLGETGILGGVTAFIGTIAGALGISFGAAVAVVALAVAAIIAVIAGLVYLTVKHWDTIKAAIGSAVDWIVAKWTAYRDFMSPLWNTINAIITTAIGVLKAIILIPLAMVGTLIITEWEWVRDRTAAVWGAIKQYVITPLTDLYNRYVAPIMAKIGDTVHRVWDGLSNGLAEAWGVISTILKSSLNFVIGIVNGAVSRINDLIRVAKSMDKTGLLKNLSYVHTVPLLAEGGTVASGRMFVAGEAGPELIGSFGGNPNTVMPLENSGFVEAVAGAVYSAVVRGVGDASGGGDLGDVYLYGEKVGELLRKAEFRSGVSSGLVRVSG